jgi:hypothetical protein
MPHTSVTELDAIKADLDYRNAVVVLPAVTGQVDCP